MKVQTIIAIRDILKQKRDIAAHNYKITRQRFEQEYQSEWFVSELIESDKRVWEGVKNQYQYILDILEDFENHQW